MNQLTFATGNEQKVALAQRFMQTRLVQKAVDMDEIQSLSFTEVAEHKVRQAYAALNEPVVVQDSGVRYNALKGLPGPFVRPFVEALGSSEALCGLLDHYDDRSAIAVSCVAYFDGTNLKVIEKTAPGTVARTVPTDGDRWHGWSDSFIYDGTNRPWPQLTEEEQNRVSMTGASFVELQKYLDTLTKVNSSP